MRKHVPQLDPGPLDPSVFLYMIFLIINYPSFSNPPYCGYSAPLQETQRCYSFMNGDSRKKVRTQNNDLMAKISSEFSIQGLIGRKVRRETCCKMRWFLLSCFRILIVTKMRWMFIVPCFNFYEQGLILWHRPFICP